MGTCFIELLIDDKTRDDPNSFLNVVSFKVAPAFYEFFYQYFTLIVCPVSALFNLGQVGVLAQKELRNNVLNQMLMLHSLIEFVHLTLLFVLGVHDQIVSPYELKVPLSWKLFLFIHGYIRTMLPSTVLYLNVATAVVRLRSIEKMSSSTDLQVYARKCLFLMGLWVAGINSLWFVSFILVPSRWAAMNVTIYTMDQRFECAPSLFYAIDAVFNKILPCILNAYFTYSLRLQTKRVMNSTAGLSKQMQERRRRLSDRMSQMMVAMLALFTLTQIPIGMVALFGLISVKIQSTAVYLGEIFEFITIMDSFVCLVVYPLFSSQKRNAARTLYKNLRLSVFSRSTHSVTLVEECKY